MNPPDEPAPEGPHEAFAVPLWVVTVTVDGQIAGTGVLIDSTHVLTARHVVTDDNGNAADGLAVKFSVGPLGTVVEVAGVCGPHADVDVTLLTLAGAAPAGVKAGPLRQVTATLFGRWTSRWLGIGLDADGYQAISQGAYGRAGPFGRHRLEVTAGDEVVKHCSGGPILAAGDGGSAAYVVALFIKADDDGRAPTVVSMEAVVAALSHAEGATNLDWATLCPPAELQIESLDKASQQAWGLISAGDRAHWVSKGSGHGQYAEVLAAGETARSDLFVGRTAALGKVLDHLGADETGERCALVVTGEPGAGKSAILGRIVRTALDPSARPAAGDAPAAEPGLLDCAVHLREKSPAEVADEISTQLGAEPVAKERNDWPALWLDDIAETPAVQKGTLRLVFDALDESRDVAEIARQVITPLVEVLRARVVVGSRRSAEEALSVCATTLVDLNHSDYFTAEDVVQYALRVLRDDPRAGNPYLSSATAAQATARGIAAQAGENFLVARLIAARRAMADSSAWLTEWNDGLSPSTAQGDIDITQAFLDYLAAVDDQAVVRGTALPALTATLLTPLAFARGDGFTLDVWRHVLLGLTGIDVTTQDVTALLGGPVHDFVVLGSDIEGNPRARLYHQELTDTLKHKAQAEAKDAPRLVFDAIWAVGQDGGWSSCDGYIRDHLMDHAIEAGLLDGANREVDQVYLNDEFLLVGEVESLLRAQLLARNPDARRRAALLKFAGPKLLEVPRGQRWQTLALRAVMEGMPPLNAEPASQGWLPMWAHVRTTTDHSPLYGHTTSARALTFGRLPGGKTVLATANRAIRFWDPASGHSLRDPLIIESGTISSLAFGSMRDGTRVLASGGSDCKVRLWNAFDGRPICDPLVGRWGRIHAVTLASLPDGQTVLAHAGDDGTVVLTVLEDGAHPRATLRGHIGRVNSLAFGTLNDGSPVLVSCGSDATVRLWDPCDAQAIGRPLRVHTGPVNAVTLGVLRDGPSLLASAGNDGTVKLLDLNERTVRGDPLLGHVGRVLALATGTLSDGSLVLASAGEDGRVLLWNGSDGSSWSTPMRGHTGPVSSLAFARLSDDSLILASAGLLDAAVRLWNPTWERVKEPSPIGHTGTVNALAFGALTDGSPVLVSGGADGTVRLWNAETGDARGGPMSHEFGAVNSVAFGVLPGGSRVIASAGDDGTVRFWSPEDCSPMGAARAGHQGPVRSVAMGVHPSGGPLLVSGGSDGTVRLWDPTGQGQWIDELHGHASTVWAVVAARLRRGSDIAASAGALNAEVRFWDPSNGDEVVLPQPVHDDWVRALAFHTFSDGRSVFAAGGAINGEIRLWDAMNGQAICPPIAGHVGSVRSLAFAPDVGGGELLASAGADGSVRFWNAADGNPKCPQIINHAGSVRAVAFGLLSDGSLLLATAGTTIAVFRAPDAREPKPKIHEALVPPASRGARRRPSFTH